MPIASVAEDEQAGTGNFDVRTMAADTTCATVRVTGLLRERCAPLLASVLDGHLRAGRRFVRLNLRGVDAVAPAVVAELHRAHVAFLQRRGTLILTGVGPAARAALLRSRLGSDLFVLAPTADELLVVAPF